MWEEFERALNTHGYIQTFSELYSANLWDQTFGDEEYEFERAIHMLTVRSFYSFTVQICGMNCLGRKNMGSKELWLHSDISRALQCKSVG
jgi:hypothetical protein